MKKTLIIVVSISFVFILLVRNSNIHYGFERQEYSIYKFHPQLYRMGNPKEHNDLQISDKKLYPADVEYLQTLDDLYKRNQQSNRRSENEKYM